MGKACVQVVVPNRGTIDTRLMVLLMNLMRDGRYDLHYAFPVYSPVASARNRIAREFLESPRGFDYLLMIDADVVPERNPLDLVEDDLDVVGQLCPIWKGLQAPGREVMWNFVPSLGSLGGGLCEVEAVGAGCMLIARRVLEHPGMRAPFREGYDEDGVLALGEDVAFCSRARENGFLVWADLEARCSHNRTVDLRQVGNAILTRRGEPVLSPRMALGDKGLIFCLSPGRCGTRWLSVVMGCVPGVRAFHEPEPNFARVMRMAQGDPRVAYEFWLEDKLPAIAAVEAEVYFESSHLFNKGFVKPLLHLGVVPGAIVIEREPREVALSYWRRRAIPGRTEMGRKYLVQPDDRGNCLPLMDADWGELSDYQLCLWYALEQRMRDQILAVRLRQMGGRTVEVDFEELVGTEGDFGFVVEELGLPEPDWERFRAVNRPYNENSVAVARRPEPEDLEEQEEALFGLLREGGLVWD